VRTGQGVKNNHEKYSILPIWRFGKFAKAFPEFAEHPALAIDRRTRHTYHLTDW
jgi:hypothetical protein